MYKRFCLIVLSFWLFQSCFAQDWEYKCYSGFEYKISDNVNWGRYEPVVTYVEPWSAAYYAGLKINDIIMEVGCMATYLRDSILIKQWIQDTDENPSIRLTIRNSDSYFSGYDIDKECRTANSITEQEIAAVFAPYSYENFRNQFFSMPIKVRPMNIEAFDYSDFHTFDFYKEGEGQKLNENVESVIEASLLNKGIKRDIDNPDFYVKYTSAFTANNTNLPAGNLPENKDRNNCNSLNIRYNVHTEKMEVFPIAISKQDNALYQAKLKVEFFEKKIIDSTKCTLIWSAEIEERLSEKISGNHYQEVYIPLILQQYPYTKVCNNVTFEVQFRKYLYTGIIYDKQDMKKVADIDRFGPAYAAGIHMGNEVLAIEKKETLSDWDTLLADLASFTTNTLRFRDQSKCFDSGKKCTDCMFWNVNDKNKLRKEFGLAQNRTVFSYLFGYADYINSNYKGKIEFEVSNGRIRKNVAVKPILREQNILRVSKTK